MRMSPVAGRLRAFHWVLPLAALATFILMHWFGMSANLMSLGGLAIAIGMLVDAAVVVVENIVTHLTHDEQQRRVPRLHVIYRAVRAVRTADKQLVWMLGTFIVPCTVMYATSMANVGLIVRQRLVIVAAMFILAAVYVPKPVEKLKSAKDLLLERVREANRARFS